MHDGTRVIDLARDNRIGRSSAYRNLDEAADALAVNAPTLCGALLAAEIAGHEHEHVIVDETVVRTGRCHVLGPTKGVDLWWRGKHRAHGGNVQVVSTRDGHLIWVSDVLLGREYDLTYARAAGLPEAIEQV